jgi:DNA (cytosine-5)-methyltransferase 1
MKDAAQASVHALNSAQLFSNGELSPSAYWAAECRKSTFLDPAIGARELRVVDLFSGCGGLSLGALIASRELGRRLKVALAADVWNAALDVYRANFSNLLETSTSQDLSAFLTDRGDVTLSKVGREVARVVGSVDVVLAGPPCQGNSDLNNSSRRDDPRNLLYAVPVAFGIHVGAKIIIVENVPPVVHSRIGVVATAFEDLVQAGYAVHEFVANALNVGLAQTRKRHVLIASKVHSKEQIARALYPISHRPSDPVLWDFIHDLEFEAAVAGDLLTQRSKLSSENVRRIDYLFDADVFDLPNALRPACHRDREHSYVSMYGRLRRDLPAQTITGGFGSMGQGRFVHPTQRRMLTCHEAARVQGFPDYFKFCDVTKVTALREMIGNAVAPPVAAAIIKLLIESSEPTT